MCDAGLAPIYPMDRYSQQSRPCGKQVTPMVARSRTHNVTDVTLEGVPQVSWAPVIAEVSASSTQSDGRRGE